VAKRVRRSRSAHRPGGQGPSRAKKTPESEAPSVDEVLEAEPAEELPSGFTDSEVEVDEVAAAAVAETTAVAATATQAESSEARPTRRRDRRRTRKQRPDDLEARAAAETVWVRADLRRIGIVSLVLFAALAVCWVVFGVVDVLDLY
jgi:hypothetical protein